jgi:hypothetical protein
VKELSASGLADLAGVTEPEVGRLVELGVLVPRDSADPFRETMCRRSACRVEDPALRCRSST